LTCGVNTGDRRDDTILKEKSLEITGEDIVPDKGLENRGQTSSRGKRGVRPFSEELEPPRGLREGTNLKLKTRTSPTSENHAIKKNNEGKKKEAKEKEVRSRKQKRGKEGEQEAPFLII